MITACHQIRLLGDFEPYFHCACAETDRILLPVSNLTTPFDPAWSKTYIVTKFWLKRNFSGILSHVLLRMRRNGQNTTSGIQSDHAIRSGMPENLYVGEIVAENAILRAL